MYAVVPHKFLIASSKKNINEALATKNRNFIPIKYGLNLWKE